MSPDPRWGLLEVARRRLLDRFGAVGVVRVEYVAGFPQLGLSSVWLCTVTEQQSEAIEANLPTDNVERILLDVGFQPADLRQFGIVCQSQETVDRDYEGSWFYAMR